MKLKNKTLAVCNGRMMKTVLILKRTTKSPLGTDLILISIVHQPSAKNVLNFLICSPFCLPKVTNMRRFGKPHEPSLQGKNLKNSKN